MKMYRVSGSAMVEADVLVEAASPQDARRRASNGEGRLEPGSMLKRSWEADECSDPTEVPGDAGVGVALVLQAGFREPAGGGQGGGQGDRDPLSGGGPT
jgi:hypothetical protein